MHNFVILCEYNKFFKKFKKDLKSGARANRANN